jgi:hypothetical protein
MLAPDVRRAHPLLSSAANPDRVADSLAFGNDKVQTALACFDNNRAWRFPCKINDLSSYCRFVSGDPNRGCQNDEDHPRRGEKSGRIHMGPLLSVSEPLLDFYSI